MDASLQELRRILVLASDHARNLRHNYVGSEHVLCALAEAGDPSVDTILKRRFLRVEDLREAVVRIVGTGPHPASDDVLPLTPRLRQILKESEAERARATGTSIAQSLLAGIALEGGGVAARALRSLDFDCSQVLEELRPST